MGLGLIGIIAARKTLDLFHKLITSRVCHLRSSTRRKIHGNLTSVGLQFDVSEGHNIRHGLHHERQT